MCLPPEVGFLAVTEVAETSGDSPLGPKLLTSFGTQDESWTKHELPPSTPVPTAVPATCLILRQRCEQRGLKFSFAGTLITSKRDGYIGDHPALLRPLTVR